MIVTVPVSVTDEELEQIGEANPGWRVEIVAGVVVMSPTNSDAGLRNTDLIGLLWTWAKDHDYRAFDSSTGFRTSSKDVLSPDCALITSARWDAMTLAEQRTFGPVPDVVVELISSKYEATDEHRKCERWFAFGVSYVVALDPYGKPKVRTWGTPPPDFPTDWSSVVD